MQLNDLYAIHISFKLLILKKLMIKKFLKNLLLSGLKSQNSSQSERISLNNNFIHKKYNILEQVTTHVKQCDTLISSSLY